ncbi:type II toxin-antitoxin system RelE family toxin [Janibacter melonis]|uniref:type II toxin-antitoxin system RelE family toxin n=1 Tax=Janibacter melonis TaxID=262209 RepID=UPI0027E2686B|nr:type II toxin-antitoxin system RelE/ParE family toxin [Janibacter melonis]
MTRCVAATGLPLVSDRKWEVEFSPPAVRSLARLTEKVATAVVEFVTVTLPSDPYRMSEPLQGDLSEWRVARRGEYRVTLKLLDDDQVILIGRIEHRVDVYRPR